MPPLPVTTRRLRTTGHLLRAVARAGWPLEPELVGLVGPLRPGAVCADVGASYGAYTLAFADRVGPAGRVLSFEPLPGPRAFLRRVVRLTGADQVEVRDAALGSGAGAATMSLPRRYGLPVHGRAFVADDAVGPGSNAEFATAQRVPVPVTTLDRVVEERGIGRLDVLKVDVEGAEPAVLAGATRTLDRFRPVVMLEIEARHLARFQTDPEQVVALLVDRGYRMSRYEDGRWRPAAEVTESARNYLFAAA